MIKKLVAAILIGTASISHAGLINWSGAFGDTKNWDGVDLVAGWVVGLYSSEFESLNFADLTESREATSVIYEDESAPLPEMWTYGITAVANIDVQPHNTLVWTVIFNATSWGAIDSSSSYIIVDASPFDSGSVEIPTPPLTYNNTTIEGTWQPVPEPGTLALLGLGLAAVVARRRKTAA